MSLKGRVALVTGGSRGIGRAVATTLAADGASVAVNYVRRAEAAQEVVAAIGDAGGDAFTVQGAVEDPHDTARMVDEVTARFGPIDILVNNAGVASRGLRVADTEPGEVEHLMRIHAFAAHDLARLVVPDMRERTRGDIVMISSVATKLHEVGGAPYAMAKAALEQLAFTLAREEAVHGIRVNVVAPGVVDTDMGERLLRARGLGPDDVATRYPGGRVCRPDDVAEAVRFLVTSEYVSGQRIYLDGGGPW